MIDCPCCGHPVKAPDLETIIDVCDLSKMQARVFGAIWRGRGHPVPSTKVIDAMYADDPNGGPYESEAYVRLKVCMCRLRKKLARLKDQPIEIETTRLRGHRVVIKGK